MQSRYNSLEKSALWWHNKASDLHASAGVLWVSMDDKNRETIRDQIGLAHGFDLRVACSSVCYMLWGLSFELLFKSLIVVNNIKVPPPNIHNLCGLAEKGLFQLSKNEKRILDVLSSYIVWQGKYPIPLKEIDFDRANVLENQFMSNKVKLGKLTVRRYNGALNWDNLNSIWKRASSKFFDEYNKLNA